MPKEKKVKEKTPLSIILISILILFYSVIGIIATLFFIQIVGPAINKTALHYGVNNYVANSYLYIMFPLLISCIIDLIASIGFIKLKKWSIYVYVLLFVVYIFSFLSTHSIRFTLIPLAHAVALGLGYRYRKLFT